MPRERSGGSQHVTIASPLYSEGVGHAEVCSPIGGTDTPDPLGYLNTTGTEASMHSGGSDRYPQEWNPDFPDDDGKS